MVDAHQPIRPGDICRHGANAFPRYRVIHVQDGKAWLRDVDTGADAVVDITACRQVSHEAVADTSPHESREGDSLIHPPPGPGA